MLQKLHKFSSFDVYVPKMQGISCRLVPIKMIPTRELQ